MLEKLAAPFPPETISWRVGATTADKSRGMALAYIDARDVQDRLNDVCGADWQVRHPWSAEGKLACEIGIKIDGEWLWRGDGAGDSDVEAEKGAFSDSFKRAAVRWGIGRYLYDLASSWVELEQKGKTHIIPAKEMARLKAMLGGNAPPAKPAASAPRPPVDHPRRQDALEAYGRIKKALENASTQSVIDDIVKLNKEDLTLIGEVSAETAAQLRNLAEARKGEVLSAGV